MTDKPPQDQCRTDTIQVGDWVRLTVFPPDIARLLTTEDPDPMRTAEVFRVCLGRVYRVASIQEIAAFEEHAPFSVYMIDVSPDIDARFGGFMNTLGVTVDEIEVVNREESNFQDEVARQ